MFSCLAPCWLGIADLKMSQTTERQMRHNRYTLRNNRCAVGKPLGSWCHYSAYVHSGPYYGHFKRLKKCKAANEYMHISFLMLTIKEKLHEPKRWIIRSCFRCVFVICPWTMLMLTTHNLTRSKGNNKWGWFPRLGQTYWLNFWQQVLGDDSRNKSKRKSVTFVLV